MSSDSSESTQNPWSAVVRVRNELGTADNWLDDALDTLVSDVPMTQSQAQERIDTIESQLENAERNIQRARKHLGIGTDSAATRTESDRDLDATDTAAEENEDEPEDDEATIADESDDEPADGATQEDVDEAVEQVEDSESSDEEDGAAIRSYIEQRVAQSADDRFRFTARDLADELNLSGQTVGGTLLGIRRDEGGRVNVNVDGETEDGAAKYIAVPASGTESPTLDEVRKVAQDVTSVQELGERLDVADNRARTLAMDADVYTPLQDRVERPHHSGGDR